MSIFSELHRRNVVRVGIAYTVTAWLLVQVADVVMENIGAPAWVMKALLFMLMIGVIPALLFAWVFELTPEGLKRESQVAAGESVVHQTRRKLDTLIILMLVGVVGYLVWETRFSGASSPATADAGGKRDGPAAPADYAPAEKSIAVLPFVNLSSDPEQDYFSDGISEELLNVLAQIPQLRVAARTSSFQFKGDNRDIGEIARLLNVNHVLEGSVRKAGTRLRITAQLIEAEQGYHLWSNTYDRELADVFAIQDEISAAIADALRAELALGGAKGTGPVAATSNSAAYEAFLKGRALINRRGNIAITQAVRELEKSVRLDPDYAPARAQLAMGIALLNNSSSTYGDLSLVEVNERAGEQLRMAERLAPDIAEVWAAKALLANVNNRDADVVAHADRALAIRPNYVDVLNWKVNALGSLGRFEQTRATREFLLEIDPLSVIGRLNSVSSIAVADPERAKRIAASIAPQSAWASHTAFAQIHSQTQEPLAELEHLLAAYAIDAQDLLINFRLMRLFAGLAFSDEAMRVDRDLRGWALVSVGRHAEAETALRRLVAADPASIELRTGLADALYFQRRFEEAVAVWRTTLIDTDHGQLVYSNSGTAPSLRFAHALGQVGDAAGADALEEALARTFEAYAGAVGRGAGWYFDRAALAVLQGERETAQTLLKAALGRGWYAIDAFDEPLFDDVRGEAAFEAARSEAVVAQRRHRADILRLMCDDNPIPDSWRPLEDSCANRDLVAAQ